MTHVECSDWSGVARFRAALVIGALLLTLMGCGGGDPVSPGPKGDCVAQDLTVVRRNVTREQCAEICPTCSWVSTDDQ